MELQLVDSSSLPVTSKPPTAMQAVVVAGEGYPDEFKQFTDHQLQSKITRLRAVRSRTSDGGEKAQKMAYRLEQELDRRRAARPRKDEGGAGEVKNLTDQDLRLKNKRLHSPNCSTDDCGKKLQKCVEKELDRRHADEDEAGRIQAVQTPSVGDPALVPQVENTSNHAPIIDSEAANLKGEGSTSINLGAEGVEPTKSTCFGQKEEDTGKRDKRTQIGGVLENNLDLKMKQTQKVVEEVIEAPKQENRFTIEKCVCVLEAIEELTDLEKVKVLRLFKCGMNREIFMTIKSASLRLLWLRSESMLSQHIAAVPDANAE